MTKYIREKLVKYNKIIKKEFGFTIKTSVVLNLEAYTFVAEAGSYDDGSHEIRLHKKLYKEYRNKYVNDVLPHEFAHLVVYELNKKRRKKYTDHGKFFKEVCSLLQPRKRKREIVYAKVLEGKQENFYIYRCDCSHDYIFSEKLHKEILDGAEYYCPQCKKIMKFNRIAPRFKVKSQVKMIELGKKKRRVRRS
jgi:SprT protein